MKYLSCFSLSFVFLFGLLQAQTSTSLTIPEIPHTMVWENVPLSHSYKNNTLIITGGAKTDMFRDPNVTYNTDNAPKLLFHPDEDFILTTAIEHGFVNKWDGGAIVLKQDSLHWIKFCFEKDYTGAHRIVSVVTKEISDDCNSVEIPGNKIFYKIAKAGKVITLYYSTTGEKWFLVRHLQFESDKNVSVGFLVQSPTGEKCEVKFTNIRYEARKIKDPYAGE